MVFGGWVHLKAFLGTRVVRQNAQTMGSNYGWVRDKPPDSPLTGARACQGTRMRA
jgi:hypothetical protein